MITPGKLTADPGTRRGRAAAGTAAAVSMRIRDLQQRYRQIHGIYVIVVHQLTISPIVRAPRYLALYDSKFHRANRLRESSTATKYLATRFHAVTWDREREASAGSRERREKEREGKPPSLILQSKFAVEQSRVYTRPGQDIGQYGPSWAFVFYKTYSLVRAPTRARARALRRATLSFLSIFASGYLYLFVKY